MQSRRAHSTTSMFKFLLILALGIAMGYFYGFNDAQTNEKHIAERFVDRIGGDSKENMRSDADAIGRSVTGK